MGVSLGGMSLTNANFTNANLINDTIDDAHGATVVGAKMYGFVWGYSGNWTNSTITNEDLTTTSINAPDFSGATLSGDHWGAIASYMSPNFTNANLTESTFKTGSDVSSAT